MWRKGYDFLSEEDDDQMNFMTRKWIIKNFWNKNTVKVMRECKPFSIEREENEMKDENVHSRKVIYTRRMEEFLFRTSC